MARVTCSNSMPRISRRRRQQIARRCKVIAGIAGVLTGCAAPKPSPTLFITPPPPGATPEQVEIIDQLNRRFQFLIPE